MKSIAIAAGMIFAFSMVVAMAAEKSAARKAVEMADGIRVGVCSSMMKEEDKKEEPYLSIMGFYLDKGCPTIFISDLAQHTENLNRDGTASFLVYKEDPDDTFNSSRMTFQGKFVKVTDKKEVERVAEGYCKKYPQAKFLYENLGDFHFYRMELTAIHAIGGFGDISWLNVKEFQKAASE